MIATRDPSDALVEALESALTQSRPPDEVVIVDDGSSRSARDVLGARADDVTLVETPPRGVAAARNAALEVVTSTFFAVLDDDDVWLPDRLEALAELAAARPDLDVLATDARIEARGSVVARFHEHTPFEVADQRTAILDRCFVPWPAMRTERLRAVGGFDTSFRTGEDWEVAIRLILDGAVAGLVDAPLYRYRLNSGGLTSNRLQALDDRVRLLEKTMSHPALTARERVALRRSITAARRRVARARAETGLLGNARNARTLALRMALASGTPFAERAAALGWAVAPRRARRQLERTAPRDLVSTPPGRR